MKQTIELMATLDPGAKDYFKPLTKGKLKGFKKMPVFNVFDNDNLKHFTFYAKYDHDDKPIFSIQCFDDNNHKMFIPVNAEYIQHLIAGHILTIDNIILEVKKQ